MYISEENYLAHYGVKGMKWGVRRYQPYPSGNKRASHPSSILSTNPSGLVGKASYKFLNNNSSKTANKGSAPTTSPLRNKITSPFKKTAMMRSVGISAKDARKGSKFVMPELTGHDKDIVFRKGSIVQHVMTTPDKDIDRHLFVAATPEDKANYAGFFAALTKYRNKADTMYRMELKANETLISPGKQKRVEEFLKLYNDDKVNISRELAEFNKREYGGYFKKDVDYYAKQFENMSMKELKSTGYYTFFNSLFSSDYNREQYFNRLKSQGYNSVVDDNDKRSFMQSKAPLIVFNAQETLSKKKISELSMDEIQENMIKWSRMKHADAVGNFLMHYGVKGMKWGVRHDKERLKQLKAERKTARKNFKTWEYMPEGQQYKAQYRYADMAYRNEKTLQKMSEKPPTQRMLTLTQRYLDQGYNTQDAQLKAYKRAKLERNAAILAGVGVAAAGAYLTYRHFDKNVDRFIPGGTKLQHLSTVDFANAKEGLYTTYKQSDKDTYKAIFSNHLMNSRKADFVYDLSFGVDSAGLKVASEKSGVKIVQDLWKNDPEFKGALTRELASDNKRFKVSKSAKNITKKARQAAYTGDNPNRAMYEVVNVLLDAQGSKDAMTVRSKFISKLNSEGYDAVIDVFDKGKRWTNYGAKSPLIVTNTSKIKRTNIANVLDKAQQSKAENKYIAKGLTKTAIGATIATSQAYNIGRFIDDRVSMRQVDKYMKEHPNTQMTALEIRRMLESNKKK